jgi:hypothetical protein
VSILDPIITWGEQSFGLTGYTLTYNIHVYTKQLPADQSRDMLNKIMHRIIELCDLKTNTDLTGTCTQMDVIHANPNKKMLVSGKTVRRMGEIRVQTLLTLQL